jgi:hypothetical protein
MTRLTIQPCEGGIRFWSLLLLVTLHAALLVCFCRQEVAQ